MVLQDPVAKLPLTGMFDTPNARVLDHLLSNEGFDYTADEISDLAAVPKRTLQRSLRLLLREQMITRRKKNGRTFYYTANLSSPRVGGLLDYLESTMLSNLESIMRNNSLR